MVTLPCTCQVQKYYTTHVTAVNPLEPYPVILSAVFTLRHSAVMGMGSVGSLRKLRSEVKAAGKAPNAKPPGSRPRNAAGPEYCKHPAVKAHSLPFPG